MGNNSSCSCVILIHHCPGNSLAVSDAILRRLPTLTTSALLGACVKRGCSAICPDGNVVVSLLIPSHSTSLLDINDRFPDYGERESVSNPPGYPMYISVSVILTLFSFVLANTEVLHEKIQELSHRVRELEDALSESHAELHSDRHPLLRDELLKIKNPLEREVGQKRETEPEETQAVDALGSL